MTPIEVTIFKRKWKCSFDSKGGLSAVKLINLLRVDSHSLPA